jgi:hypothetical protein
VGTFALRGLAASSLRPCGSPVPITRDAAFSCPLFTLNRILGGLRGYPPQELWVSSLAWLLACRCVARCCLRPRGVDSVLVSIALTAWPAPSKRGSARSQHSYFSGLCVRFRATPFTSPHSLVFLPACAFCHYTTERLTNLTQEGLWVYPLFPLDRQPLPGHPFCLLPSADHFEGPTWFNGDGSFRTDFLTAETSNAFPIIENQTLLLPLQCL